MFRYMALIWNPANQRQSEAALLLGRRLQTKAEWQEVMHQDGLRVLCAHARPGWLEPHLFSNCSGVVLGHLFERNGDPEDATPSRTAVLGVRQTAGIVSSRGKRLISDYWGNYVAFLRDPDAAKVWVLKDPAGTLPCYSTVFRGATIFFSCIADCTELGLLSFSINPAYLKHRVSGDGDGASQDALNEVSRVHGGECVEVDPRHHPGQMARYLYWNPLNFSGSDMAIEDPERAARALRGTVRSCTHTLASCHTNLLHRLSGGLDSSIVSGCLKDAPTRPRITAYTYYNPRSYADERPWAQLAASHAGCEHVERALGGREIPLATLHRMRPAAVPASVLEYVQRSLIDAPLAAERHATAIFTGDGAGFHSNSSVHAVTEYLHRHGLRPETLRVAAKLASCTHHSTFTVLSSSLRVWLRRSTAHAPPSMSTRQPQTLPVADFYNTANEPDAPSPELISPFSAQPAMELFLRIPLYVHFEGGRERGLARRAFGEEVPKPILRRMHSERATGLYDELVRRNREFLRALLMDGVLAGEGLLSRSAIDAALSGRPSQGLASPEQIFRHVDTEIWARNWVRKARRAAAGPTISEPLLFVVRGAQSRLSRARPAS